MKSFSCVAVLVFGCAINGCTSQRVASSQTTAAPVAVVREVVPMQHYSPAMAKWFLEQGEGMAVSMTVDERTNSLIIEGTPENVQKASETVALIDRPC